MKKPTNTATGALTSFENPRQKIEQLLTQKHVTRQNIADLTEIEREYFNERYSARLNVLKGTERDDYLMKIEKVMSTQTKTDIWEYNHGEISNAISTYMAQYGKMPPQSTIAKNTGLSRQTIAKHFAAYNRHPLAQAHVEQLKFMGPHLLANVYRLAIGGDIKATRLYFEMISAIDRKQAGVVVNKQNNYIQINNTILSQESLKELTNQQLNQIESIIMNKNDE